MSRILRVNDSDREPIGRTLSIHSLELLFEEVPPGRYHIEEIRHDPLPSGHTSRRWGIAAKRLTALGETVARYCGGIVVMGVM
jgi:hypothetical protein